MRAAFLFLLACASPIHAQVTHYRVKLMPDLGRQILRGEETIEFHHDAGKVEWQKQAGLQISKASSTAGEASVRDDAVSLALRNNGRHLLRLQFAAAAQRGIKWFTNGEGFDAAFYCTAWMVCDSAPDQRARLTLEIVLPAASGLTAVGPGTLKKRWRDQQGEHFVFEENKPVQTYLFSFGAAKLNRSARGRFIFYAPDAGTHEKAFEKTADAYAFLSGKAGADLSDTRYTQAAMPEPIEQEAAGLALMPKTFFRDLEEKDDTGLMAHELAHQWWGVLVGIRSWSDFWLNEGMADFMTDAYLEHHKGKPAYDEAIAAARERLDKLREQGQDRPLHWEGWNDARGALGRIPYVKGALFLAQLRAELGEEKFWRGIALYTSRNAHRLVDSQDFQQAMEEASGRDLKTLFDAGVHH